MKKLITLIKILIFIIAFYLIFIAPSRAETGKYFIMLSTGYCPCSLCCHPFDTGLTYTGDIAGRGCVAIDPEEGY